MTDGIADQPIGATPIDDTSGLLQDITTREELNDAEALNIVNAHEWLTTGRIGDVFTVGFYRELHSRMYDQVWSWAGTLRSQTGATVEPVGAAPERTASELGRVAMEYSREWGALSQSAQLIPFIARYHHALVWVHPFNNGNGRWSRLAADAVIQRLANQAPLVWATDTESLLLSSRERLAYIDALRKADANDFRPLVNYLQSLNPDR